MITKQQMCSKITSFLMLSIHMAAQMHSMWICCFLSYFM